MTAAEMLASDFAPFPDPIRAHAAEQGGKVLGRALRDRRPAA